MAMETGLGCPTCRNLGMTQMLMTEQLSTSGYFCNNGHKFMDMGELMAMNPQKIPIPAKKTIQQGFEKVEMEIPSDLKGRLLQKFGTPDRLSATLGAVFNAISSPKCFIMTQEDIEAITKHTGIEPRTAQDLVGLCFSLKEDVKNILIRNENAAIANGNLPTNGSEPGKLIVDVESHMSKINALAKFRSESPESVCANTIKVALDNGWA